MRTVAIVDGQRLLRDRLYALGLGTLTRDGDFYGYSLALGAADVRLLGQCLPHAGAGGLASPPRWTLDAPPARPVRLLDAASSFIIADTFWLTGALAHLRLESALSTRYWSAVKTGTSKDMRDNWALGFSRRYSLSAWGGQRQRPADVGCVWHARRGAGVAGCAQRPAPAHAVATARAAGWRAASARALRRRGGSRA